MTTDHPNNPDVQIASPADLPADWYEKYVKLAMSYRRTRMWNSERQADEAAFRDTRAQLWRCSSKSGQEVSADR